MRARMVELPLRLTMAGELDVRAIECTNCGKHFDASGKKCFLQVPVKVDERRPYAAFCCAECRKALIHRFYHATKSKPD